MSLLSFTKKIAGRDKKKKASPPKVNAKKAAFASVPGGKAETVAPTPAAAPAVGGTFTRLMLQPLITEKSVSQQGAANTVAFRTRPEVTKRQIMAAVAERYGVTPVAVRTMQMLPKRRVRGRTEGRTNAWKKAYVTLPEGKNIDLSV